MSSSQLETFQDGLNSDKSASVQYMQPCHGCIDAILSCSQHKKPGLFYRTILRTKLAFCNGLWHLRTKGLLKTLKYTLAKILRRRRTDRSKINQRNSVENKFICEEVLNLRAGELVRVRPEEQILTTLDKNRKHKGLGWMAGMNRFCGRDFRVFKRLENIILESTGEHRKTKNTVLLEGVMCDGKAFMGCDRSCFYYWKEAWLMRVGQYGSQEP